MKKKILFCSEASYLLSGFGTYAREVISRLNKTGKYEIAEFASSAAVNDPRDRNVKWRFYANAVGENDPRYQEYMSKPINMFGAWRFERVLLDFKPDIVIDYRDPWYFLYQENSPLRPYFHHILMPTCDSAPQQEEWIENFMRADAVFTYTDWALDIFREQSNGRMKLQRSAPMGIVLDEHKAVVNKSAHRRQLGLAENVFIVGTVMRNQIRKLYPDLMVAFNEFLELCKKNGNTELAEKTYLYFHTSHPDMAGSWNLPRLIKENGLGHKILFSYVCRNCGVYFPSFFKDARTVCPNCHQVSASLPTIAVGLNNKQMNDMYNLFDAYVQYSSCEGFGGPSIEGAATETPVFGTDYSGISDVVRKLNGYPIKVKRMFRSPSEDALRALPDNTDFAEQLYKFLSLPISYRQKKGRQARKGVEKHYDWDKTAKIWEEYFDRAELTGLQGKWDDKQQNFCDPNRYVNLDENSIPPNTNNEQFVEWAIMNTIGDSRYLDSLLALDMLRALNYGVVSGAGQNPTPYGRKQVMEKCKSIANNINMCEQARLGMIQMQDEDYLQYAKIKAAIGSGAGII